MRNIIATIQIRGLVVLVAAMALAGCAEPSAPLSQARPTGVVELQNGQTYRLEAAKVQKEIGGKTQTMLAYNGSIPGPTIKVRQGDEVTITLVNRLDTPTTLHSHGVRLKNEFDGVPNVTQKPVRPGEEFAYKIKFQDEGMYWYHPHVREDSQQELGLYGNFWVVGDSKNWNPVNREVPMFVDDILMGSRGVAPSGGEFATHALMGRFGNTMLLNGETDYSMEAKAGEVVRFYITNAANTRTFNLKIPGVRLKAVGGDSGRAESDSWVESILLGPSERAIVEAYFEKPGTHKIVHETPERTYAMGGISVTDEKVSPSYAADFERLKTNADVQRQMNEIRRAARSAMFKRLRIDIPAPAMAGGMAEGQHMMHGGQMMPDSMMPEGDDSEPIEWEDTMAMMNAMSNSKTVEWKLIDQDTGMENMDIDWKFRVGDLVRVEIFNDPKSFHPMQHPIHFHGQRFAVLSRNGIPNPNLVWKDTLLVGKGETTEILLLASNPGEWMAHCHIPEHMESGMMMSFEVL